MERVVPKNIMYKIILIKIIIKIKLVSNKTIIFR